MKDKATVDPDSSSSVQYKVMVSEPLGCLTKEQAPLWGSELSVIQSVHMEAK